MKLSTETNWEKKNGTHSTFFGFKSGGSCDLVTVISLVDFEVETLVLVELAIQSMKISTVTNWEKKNGTHSTFFGFKSGGSCDLVTVVSLVDFEVETLVLVELASPLSFL